MIKLDYLNILLPSLNKA